jgi:cytoplasmic FMR1 interacting protein
LIFLIFFGLNTLNFPYISEELTDKYHLRKSILACKLQISSGQQITRERPPQMPQYFLWGSKQLNATFSTQYGQYKGFLGTAHFRSICQLLDNQGIAVVMEIILKDIVKSLIQGNFLLFTKTLMSAMPKRCF